ncbi:MAG: hypothetical protein Ct9H300mP19_20380 [Dehalococcoidia bacterium]|nr:MAG: hypothetical protein Ct9H300mP19_20380 [Dehalococcoidia bacterium]
MFHRSVGRRLSDNSLVIGPEWHEGENPEDLDFRGEITGSSYGPSTALNMHVITCHQQPVIWTHHQNRSSHRWTIWELIRALYQGTHVWQAQQILGEVAGAFRGAIWVWHPSKNGKPMTLPSR